MRRSWASRDFKDSEMDKCSRVGVPRYIGTSRSSLSGRGMWYLSTYHFSSELVWLLLLQTKNEGFTAPGQKKRKKKCQDFSPSQNLHKNFQSKYPLLAWFYWAKSNPSPKFYQPVFSLFTPTTDFFPFPPTALWHSPSFSRLSTTTIPGELLEV